MIINVWESGGNESLFVRQRQLNRERAGFAELGIRLEQPIIFAGIRTSPDARFFNGQRPG